MTPLEALRDLQSRSLVALETGEPCPAELIPPPSPDALAALEQSLGPIPPDIRELMTAASGVHIDALELDWAGNLGGGLAIDGAFPVSLPLLEDGAGNSWDVDIDPDTGLWGPVYYLCHDPPVIVRQASSLAEFITQVADECCQPDREGQLNLVAERLANRIYSGRGRRNPAASLRTSPDPVLRAAATAAPDDAELFDLRTAANGDGFPWARFGPRTTLHRPGPAPIWTAHRPATSKRWWKLWA